MRAAHFQIAFNRNRSSGNACVFQMTMEGRPSAILSSFCHPAVSRFSPVGLNFTAFGWEVIVGE
jgi:hypothetical protein